MRVEPGGLPGLVVVTPDVHLDQRGFFLETWREARYREHGKIGRASCRERVYVLV